MQNEKKREKKEYTVISQYHNTAVTILSRIFSENEQDNIRYSFPIKSYTVFKGWELHNIVTAI